MDYDEELSDINDVDFEMEDDSVRKGFDQHELNDLARDLGLSELLASRLKEKNLLEKGAKYLWIGSRILPIQRKCISAVLPK